MIIIITGATHTGKTLLAQRLLEKYKYPYLSIDHLKMGLIRGGYTALTAEDDDEMTVYIWPVVREIIKTAVENKQNLIVEGCYVPFDWRKDFTDRYLENIKIICLAMTDEYIDSHIDEINLRASAIEARDETLTAEYLKAENGFYINGFEKSGEKVTLIREDYEKTIGSILNGEDAANLTWHPHSNLGIYRETNNTIYIASEKLSRTDLPGYGTFRYDDALVLTKENCSRSRWNLPEFFKEVHISHHNQNSFKAGFFQSVPIGQEFVISEDERIIDWAYNIIRIGSDHI